MSDFVEQCRQEWKRLGVPDPLAEEMAAALAGGREAPCGRASGRGAARWRWHGSAGIVKLRCGNCGRVMAETAYGFRCVRCNRWRPSMTGAPIPASSPDGMPPSPKGNPAQRG